MNILQIIDNADKGGAEREMSLISKEVSLRGHTVFVIHPSGMDTTQFKKLESSTLKVFEYPVKQFNFIKTVLFLRSFINKHNINIIHSHLYFSDFVSFLSRLGLKNVRHIITLHMYLLQAKPKVPFRKIQLYLCAFFSYHFSSKILAVSQDLCEHTRKKFFLPHRKVVRVFNGLDFNQFSIDYNRVSEIKHQYSISSTDIVLLNLGQLNYEKGQEFLVDAIGQHFSNNTNVKCFLLGNDRGLGSLLREKIKYYNCENRIFLPGFQTDFWNWLYCADIYVHPTLNDAMPLSIIEAMYFKKPVIASDLPTFNGLIENKKNGLIVKKKSVSEIAAAIDLLMNNKNVFDAIKQNAFDFVVSNCSIKVTVNSILDYYTNNEVTF